MKRFATRVLARVLAPLALTCALALPLTRPAQAQFPGVPPIVVPGFGTVLMVPMSLLPQLFALNQQANLNQIGNTQIGATNFALIAVNQANLAVPANAVGTLANLNVQLNINVINNVQIGNNNVAIINVNQSNARF